jgi:hypothetical protein
MRSRDVNEGVFVSKNRNKNGGILSPHPLTTITHQDALFFKHFKTIDHNNFVSAFNHPRI